LLLGDGHGSLASPSVYPTGPGPTDVAAADFNGDGVLDLATANYAAGGPGSASILAARPGGGFDAPITVPTTEGTFTLAAGDVNGDGKTDLVTANTSSSNVSVLIANGNGTFASVTNWSTGSSTWPWAVAVRDVDGDGRPDLAAADYHTSTVSILLNAGGGTFAPPTQYASGSHPVAVAAVDLDSDGKRDIVTADLHGDSVSVLLNRGRGLFAAPRTYPVGETASSDVDYPSALTTADLDHDGRLDVVVADYETSRVSILAGNGDGTLQPAVHAPTQPTPADVTAADLNGDGAADLATANYDDSSASVLLNTTFPPPAAPPPAAPPPPAPAPARQPQGTEATRVPPRVVFAKRGPRAGHRFLGAVLLGGPPYRLSCGGRIGRALPHVVVERPPAAASTPQRCIWAVPRRTRGSILRAVVVVRGFGAPIVARRSWRVA
jgi:FG-GAP-like repeat/FG-GAP repeat